MSSELDSFTQRLVDRTRARNEALKQKMQEHSFQTKKRRPLETQENTIDNSVKHTSKVDDEAEKSDPAVTIESPSKRSRVENQSLSLHFIKESPSKSKPGEKSISERMQKILNQRKQWEAVEHGEDVDFENIPSPVQHARRSPVANLPLRRKVDIDRKARLAAFTLEINNREDDLNHPKIPRSVEEFSSDQTKPSSSGIGRKTPMNDVYRSETLNSICKTDDVASNNESRPSKSVSQRVSLSIETLCQFASKDRPAPSRTPAKAVIQKKLASDKIAVSAFLNASSEVIGHQITPASKTLQERLIELQKNGCNAERSVNCEKINLEQGKMKSPIESKIEYTDLADAEKSMKENEVAIASASTKDAIDESVLSENLVIDNSMAISALSEEATKKSMAETSEFKESLDKTDRTQSDASSDESGLSFGDSMMDELDNNQVSEDKDVSTEEEFKDIESAKDGEGNVENVDDLLEGVTHISDDDDTNDPPFMADISSKGNTTLTRQKSRLEIKSELMIRKQTSNEAEDTHVIQRVPSRHLRPLARSSSSESVVSLGNEKPEPEQIIPMFTINSYRMEKRKSIRNVDKKIVRNENVKSECISRKRGVSSLKERNSILLEQVQQQQRVIQQASAALNCCYDVHHGKGSITELEAEKLLLIASEKRLALLSEIQKLKGRGKEDSNNDISPCHGTLTIENIRLPLRTEYIFSMASKKDGGDAMNHYYFILVRCGPHKIFATHLASSHDSLSADCLAFKDKFTFELLENDFEISIDVYSKVRQNHRNRANDVPNQEKSKKKLSGILHKSLTPRKLKARSIHGSVPSSPGGPNAVRISSFALVGSVTLRLSDVKKNKFVLQKVPFLSSISGQLNCKIATNFQSNATQRGFLTMFDDVGGLGAWHRRWCTLRNGVLYSWTYPDDEKHKEALSKLELRQCISRDIRTVERIMCARPNTFEMRTMRPRRDGDRENLISQDTGSVITTKHWLAADTKNERLIWIETLNQALIDVRSWDSNSLKPLS